MRIVLIAIASILTAAGASAQDVPAPAVDFNAGWVGFADDGVVNEALVGGSLRWYVSPRIALGPEIVYINGSNHSHFVVTGNVTIDLLDQRARPVMPFVVAGAGMFQTREQLFRGPYTSSEGAFTAGGGVRATVSDLVDVGVEARVGWELHLRVNGLVSFRLKN